MEATVIQRGETPTSGEFYFVHEGHDEIGKGGFVEYENDGTVIARIAEVFRTNEYFENAENVSESAEKLKQKFPVDEWEVSIAKATIMGKFKDERIQRVSSSPSPGMKVENADPERIQEFLGLDQSGLEIGEVQQQDLSASLNMTDTLQKHFAVLAQSGAGKSYTASVMLEELLDRDYSPAVVAVDPHGDYTCFAEDQDYMSDVRVFRGNQIQIAVKNLSADQISMFFNGISEPQHQELSEIFSNLLNGENKDFGLQVLMDRIERKDMDERVRYALLRKMRQLDKMNIFGKSNSPNRNDIEPGKLNILDLSDVIQHRKRQIITSYFGKRFFRLRRRDEVPPFLYLLEEAHNFAPEGDGSSPSKSVIEKLAREGRKFHASIGLISQRPVKLSTTALSQCNTKIILRVTNPNDLEHIKTSSEGITADVAERIPGLKTGEAIVIGEAVNYPTFVDVRERKSKESDAGEGLEDALKQWEREEEKKDEDVEAFM